MPESKFAAKPWVNRNPQDLNLQELYVYIGQLQAFIEQLEARVTAIGG